MANFKVMTVTKCIEHEGEDGNKFYGTQVAVDVRNGNGLIDAKAKLYWLPARKSTIAVGSKFSVDMDGFDANEETNDVGTFTTLTPNANYDAEKSVRQLKVAAPAAAQV